MEEEYSFTKKVWAKMRRGVFLDRELRLLHNADLRNAHLRNIFIGSDVECVRGVVKWAGNTGYKGFELGLYKWYVF